MREGRGGEGEGMGGKGRLRGWEGREGRYRVGTGGRGETHGHTHACTLLTSAFHCMLVQSPNEGSTPITPHRGRHHNVLQEEMAQHRNSLLSNSPPTPSATCARTKHIPQMIHATKPKQVASSGAVGTGRV